MVIFYPALRYFPEIMLVIYLVIFIQLEKNAK